MVVVEIVLVVVVVAVFCVVDLNEDARETSLAEAEKPDLKVTKTALGTDVRNTAYYHDPVFPAGVKDGLFKDDEDPAFDKEGEKVRQDKEDGEIAASTESDEKKSVNLATGAKKALKRVTGFFRSHDGSNFMKASEVKEAPTTHYAKAAKKANGLGFIWKTVKRAMKAEKKKKKEAKKTTSSAAVASDLDQYLSGKPATLPQILLPKGDNLKKEAKKAKKDAVKKGMKPVPDTDYIEMKTAVKTKNIYNDMDNGDSGSTSAHEEDKKKKEEDKKKKEKKDRFPRQDHPDPVFPKGEEDTAFGSKADIAFTKASDRAVSQRL